MTYQTSASEFLKSLLVSSPKKEGVLHASKWLHTSMLLDSEELATLFEELGEFFILKSSRFFQKDDVLYSKECLLEKYKTYVDSLCMPKGAQETKREDFSCYFTKESSPIYLTPNSSDEYLVKNTAPVIWMNAFQFVYIEEQNKFITQSHKTKSIPWGLQFSFPGLYQDPKTKCCIETYKMGKMMPNVKMFRKLQRWARHNSLPVKFLYNESQRANASFRIGKKCLNWINSYPAIEKKQLHVIT